MPGPRHAAEVVAAEVDEHHVLGALLGVALELVGDALVVSVVDPAWPRAGDGMGRHPVALDLRSSSGLAPTTSKSAVRTKKR